MDVQNPETPPVTTPATPPPAPAAGLITPPPEPKPATPAGVYLDPGKFDEITSKLSRLEQIEKEAAEKVAAAEKRAYDAAIKEGDSKKIAEMLDARIKADAERQAKEVAEARSRFEAEQKRLADDVARVQNEARAKEAKAKKYATNNELSKALGAHSERLAPNAFQQLSHMWANEFSAVEEGDSYAVRASNGQSVADFVNAALGSDYYANFLRAGGPARGGTQHPGTNPSAGSPAAPPPPVDQPQSFKNFGDALMHWTKQNNVEGVNSATDMSKPMGLGRNTGLKLAQ